LPKKRTHGQLRLEDALKVSCNAYFYQFGNAMGIDQIVAMGNMLGLGQKTGIPVGRISGCPPRPGMAFVGESPRALVKRPHGKYSDRFRAMFSPRRSRWPW
jgi:cell division protein FtsI/penicillin-binding protein 2